MRKNRSGGCDANAENVWKPIDSVTLAADNRLTAASTSQSSVQSDPTRQYISVSHRLFQ